MAQMTTPTVTEIHAPLAAVSRDPFIDDLDHESPTRIAQTGAPLPIKPQLRADARR
jgi:hypothetical protein